MLAALGACVRHEARADQNKSCQKGAKPKPAMGMAQVDTQGGVLLKFMALNLLGKQPLHYMQLQRLKKQEELQLLSMLSMHLTAFMLKI